MVKHRHKGSAYLNVSLFSRLNLERSSFTFSNLHSVTVCFQTVMSPPSLLDLGREATIGSVKKVWNLWQGRGRESTDKRQAETDFFFFFKLGVFYFTRLKKKYFPPALCNMDSAWRANPPVWCGALCTELNLNLYRKNTYTRNSQFSRFPVCLK